MLKVTAGGLVAGGMAWRELLASTLAPCFLLFPERLRQNCRAFATASARWLPGSRIHYSVKTNGLPAVLDTIAREGFGAQAVSMSEHDAVVAAGIPPSLELIDGPYREPGMFDLAGNDGPTFVESWLPNLIALNSACAARGVQARVGLRFSFPSPDKWLGFKGEDSRVLEGIAGTIAGFEHVRVVMLACHAGSQVGSAGGFGHARVCEYLLSVHEQLERVGVVDKTTWLNLGGGFPEPDILGARGLDETMAAIREVIDRHHGGQGCKACFEPGRYLVADAAALLSTIQHVFTDRRGMGWVMLDVGMDVLTRFSNSHLRAFSIEHAGEAHGTPTGFQGRLPTEQDVLAKGMHFVKDPVPGEHVIFLNVGAYTTTFSRRFSHPYPPWHAIEGGTILRRA